MSLLVFHSKMNEPYICAFKFCMAITEKEHCSHYIQKKQSPPWA